MRLFEPALAVALLMAVTAAASASDQVVISQEDLRAAKIYQQDPPPPPPKQVEHNVGIDDVIGQDVIAGPRLEGPNVCSRNEE